MAALRICKTDGCPTPVDRDAYRGLCTPCAGDYELGRGRRQQRGYDADHDRLRAAYAPAVARGEVTCWRCDQPIRPDEPWDLGHDNGVHRGPEHANRCNRSAAGKAAHAT